MTHFVGVTTGDRAKEAQSYLSGSDHIIEEVEAFNGTILIVAVESQKKAVYLSDRFNSGFFGARAFSDEATLRIWVNEWL